jgi:hypothetical protein
MLESYIIFNSNILKEHGKKISKPIIIKDRDILQE